MRVLLAQEPLGGGADRVLGAADLDDRDALQRRLDALRTTAPTRRATGSAATTGRGRRASGRPAGRTRTRPSRPSGRTGRWRSRRSRGPSTGRPLRPVTMNASFGPATLSRLITSSTTRTTRPSNSRMPIRNELMVGGCAFQAGTASRAVVDVTQVRRRESAIGSEKSTSITSASCRPPRSGRPVARPPSWPTPPR